MLSRFQDITRQSDKERECMLTSIDHFTKADKINLILKEIPQARLPATLGTAGSLCLGG